jgi:transcriptional regulator with PAS, ATPase and Fis domain
MAYMNDISAEICETLLNNTREGVALYKKSDFQLIYANKRFSEMLNLNDLRITKILRESNPKDHFDINADTRELSCHVVSNDDYWLVIVVDKTTIAELEKSNQTATQLNEELQSVYGQYEGGTIFISDEKGTFEFVTSMIESDCGLAPNEVIGKSASELEQYGFSPSVTRMAIDQGESQVVVQKPTPEKYFVSMAEALRDSSNHITKTVAVSYDYSNQIKLWDLMSQAQTILNEEPAEDITSAKIVTCSDNMLNILTLAELVATADSTVLITGETGTGKEMLAEYIHSKSKRAQNPFIRVNCGAISKNIAESELFGYEGGAFTDSNKSGKTGLFEAANGGTIFLDEIAYLPMDQQTKILNVLQDRNIIKVGSTETRDLNIRVISATNIDLEEQVWKGKFRKDLFYRINVVPIDIPPLRARKDDIPLLINHFLNVYNKKYDLGKWIGDEAFNILCQFSWPGNVRELKNVIERLVVTTKDAMIKKSDLPVNIAASSQSKPAIQINKIAPMKAIMNDVERKLIQKALKEYISNKKAAEVLGIHPATVSRKLKKNQDG